MTRLTGMALGITATLAALILYLTLAPVTVPAGLPQSDKTNHILAFAVLAFPLAAARPSWVVFAAPAFIVFGGMIELVQPYFGRGREWMDWIADIAGVGLGCVAGLLVRDVCRRLGRRP